MSIWPDSELIPGLPDDVALNCLLRLPISSHSSCRAVCRRWNLLLGSKEAFFGCRKEAGFRDPWLYVHAFCKLTEKLQWRVLDLTHFSWHTIAEMPCSNKVFPQGFRCVSLPSEGVLFVCDDSVMKYEMYKDRWSPMADMITARSFFAIGLIDGSVYVAGGHSEDLIELDSAEAFNPSKGDWRAIANMGSNMASYDSAVLDGRLLVTEGWLWPFFVSPRGRVYDPKNDNWESMDLGLREGWTGSSVVVYGRLFVVSAHERMKLKVYEKGTDSWEAIGGPPLPAQICKPFSVSSSGSRVFVVGRHLHVAVGNISRVSRKGFSVKWQVLPAPKSMTDLTPSSSQVLFA